jgi:hypothetical protein
MTEPRIKAGQIAPGEYAPAGEAQGQGVTFTADQVAVAFNVAVDRVQRAMAGEFNLQADGRVDSRQAQELAEVILGDEDLAEREAALMQLGAFTPRPDQDWGLGETAPGEESDRYAATADVIEDERASRGGSHDESQPTG